MTERVADSPDVRVRRRTVRRSSLRLRLARFLRRRSVGTRRQVGLPRLRRDIRPATMHLETYSFVLQYETICA